MAETVAVAVVDITVAVSVAVDAEEVETMEIMKSTPIVEALSQTIQPALHLLGTRPRKARISIDTRKNAVKLKSNVSMAFAVFADLDLTLPSNASTLRRILTATLRERKDSKGRVSLAIEMPTVESQIAVIEEATGFLAEKVGDDDGWLLDSGATKSITGNINDFVEYH
ncbi:hypothetical protein N7522_008817 [Penicillium canescens]|nr:hypothetical protein N7522_008817 [Penicillium canescens]